MVYPFICGPIQCIHPFSDHEEEDEEDNTSSIDDVQFPPSPKKKQPRKIPILFRRRRRKNPFANRGLDKFSAVLAELEHKRQQIYTQKGSEDISLVRFVFSDSNHITPVVVKGRDRNKTTTTTTTAAANNHVKHIQESSSSAVPNLVLQPGSDSGDIRAEESGDHNQKKKMDIWRPWYYYLPVGVILLIMVFLAMFGKSLAILCTSLVWYLVPTIEARSNSKQPKKKKKYSTTASVKKKMVADDILVGDKNKAVAGRDRESDASSSSST